MSLTLIKQPDAVNFSRNPVPFAVHTSESDAYILLKVYVDKDQHYASSWEVISTVDLAPDDDGIAYCDVQEIIDALLSYDMPDYNQTAPTWCRQVVKRFMIVAQEYVDGSPNDSVGGSAYHIIKGGVSRQEYPTAGFFSDDYMADEKMCMTWLADKKVTPAQQHYLYFLNHTGGQIAQVDLHCKAYYTDGSSSADTDTLIHTSSLMYEYTVWAFPAGYGQLSIGDITPAKTVSYYELWLEDHSDGSEITKRYKFRVDQKHRRNLRHYLYANSLGGIEPMYATGIPSLEFPVDNQQADKFRPYWYTASQGTIQAWDFSEEHVVKALTGFITADELEYLRDFRLSECKLEINNAQHLEIILNNKVKVEYGENDNLRALAFEYKYNFKNKVYTPANLWNVNPGSEPEPPEESSSSASPSASSSSVV